MKCIVSDISYASRNYCCFECSTFEAFFSDALEARELIKLHVLENSGEDPRAFVNALAEALDAEPVAATGRKIVLYRASEKNPTIVLPKA